MLQVLCLFTILITGVIQDVKGSDFGQFMAGSISYSVHRNDSTGTLFADLEVITGWVLGKGPCGVNCSKSDIGMVTNDRRLMMKNMLGDPLYFGNWTTEFQSSGITRTSDLNNAIQSNSNEKVIAMNTKARWEQDLMKVSVELANAGIYEDIYFEGDTWHPLTMQPTYLSWHIQAKIDKQIRSDTGQPNRSPLVFFKPVYRIKLNKVSTIHIAAADLDGDLIKCRESDFSESYRLSAHPLPGMTITETRFHLDAEIASAMFQKFLDKRQETVVYIDCAVIINASKANAYTVDSWGAVALMASDFNRQEIRLGVRPFTPFRFRLSSTAVQFMIHILEHLDAPVFVKPTAPANHQFIVYTGAVWRQKIYAKSNDNTTIGEFTVTGRQEEFLQVSAIMDGNESHVRYIDIKWVPKDKDIGNHIICITAIDNTGVDSDEDRCFIIEVKRILPDSSRPYFIDLPACSQVVECKINVTCVLPLYVMSKIGIKTITYTLTFFEETELSPIIHLSHNGHQVYESDLSFRDSVGGLKKICVKAVDIRGTESNETCIQSKVWPPDPCISSPCRNNGKCIRSDRDDTTYECICINEKFTGHNCEHVADACSSSPCVHGACFAIPPATFYCNCLGTGFSGSKCSIRDFLHIGHSTTASPSTLGQSHYSVNLTFYSDPNFMNEINGNPLQVHLGSLVYVKVFSTTPDWTVKMVVQTCYTKPSAASPDHLRHYFIKNGCETDANTYLITKITHETRFVYQNFEHETFSLKCDARFCDTHDSSYACSPLCHRGVK